MKALKTVWIYGWAYLFILWEMLEKFGDWLVRQIDQNDFFVGALFAWILFGLAWSAGFVRFGG